MTGQVGIGLLTGSPDPVLVDLAAQLRMQFLVVDAEQTGVTAERCADTVARLRGSGTASVIRVPDLAPDTLVTFANTGADELLLPQVRSPAEVAAAYQAVHFPPEGRRPRQVSPASRYGTEFSAAPRLSVLVETTDALDHLDDLASSGLIDALWFGPTDLADDLQRHRPGDAARRDELIDKAIAAAHAHHVPVGLPAHDVRSAAAAFDRGAELCSVYWEKAVLGMLGTLADVATTRRGDVT